MMFWSEFFKRVRRKNGGKNVIIFPGQGAQKLGMGLNISPEIMSELYTRMESVLGADITLRIQALISADTAALTAEEKERMGTELRQTQNAQLAVFLVSLARFREYVNSDNFKVPNYALGHSLGECTALVASGAISEEDGFRFVFFRGGLMHLATTLRKGGMVAIRGEINDKSVKKCLRVGADVEIANYNSPHEIVVSGGADGLASVEQALRETKNFRMVKRLPVAGAFHHPVYMKLVEDGLGGFFEEFQIKIHRPALRMLFNYTGGQEDDPKRIKTFIIKQPANTVRWRQEIEALIKEGASKESINEIGPGQIFIRQLDDFPGFKNGDK